MLLRDMYMYSFFLMIRRPPGSKRTDTLFPYTTLFRSPFAKAGIGYNYLTPDYTVRLEVGARYSIEADSKLKVGGESDTVDLQAKVNPYGEISALWNKGINNMPISTWRHYTQTRYNIASHSEYDEHTNHKQEQGG